MDESNQAIVSARRHPGRLSLFLGMLVALSGVAIYAAQLQAKSLAAPWYAPILASIGVLLIGFALCQCRSIWRWGATVLFTLFAAAEWLMLLVGLSVPAYTGPARAGLAFPEFATTLADGSAFTQNDLRGRQPTVLLFFRGRW